MHKELIKNLKQWQNKNTTQSLVSGFTPTPTFGNNKSKWVSGFTIVEALIAIFILSVSVVSLLGVTASSASSARYANNEITANYLIQEAVDSIRNSRDTIAFQHKIVGTNEGWDNFLARYNPCFTGIGCIVKIENFNPDGLNVNSDIVSCGTDCPFLNYDNSGASRLFYSYDSTGEPSRFKRQVKMEEIKVGGLDDGVKIIVKVEWLNGSSLKSRSLETILLNWQKD